MPATSRLATMPGSVISNKQLQAQMPRTVPTKFRRSISPSANRLTRSQFRSDQSASPLLAKLPLEIRLIIWEETVGKEVVQIARKKRRIGHKLRVRPIFVWDLKNREPYPRNSRLSDWSLTSLLRTCRQVYIESVNILYASNTFHFEHPWALLFMYETVLPKRWEHIRKLELVFTFIHCYHESTFHWMAADQAPDDKETWEAVCTEIMEIKSLQIFTLVVDIAWCDDDAVSGLEMTNHLADSKGLPTLLKPLQELRLQKGRPWTLLIPVWYVRNGRVETEAVEKSLAEAGFVCCVKAPTRIVPLFGPVEW